MSIVLIDHRDSFTYNLLHALSVWVGCCQIVPYGPQLLQTVHAIKPTAIVLGPGPGKPKDYSLSLDLIKRYEKSTPILGICLGHQMVAQYYGCSIIQKQMPIHGKKSAVLHSSTHLFKGISQNYTVGRYHSLVVDPKSVNKPLVVEAKDNQGIILALKHKDLPIFSVQFHPESVLSGEQSQFFSNFKDQIMESK